MAIFADDFESHGTGAGIPTGYTGRWNYAAGEWDRVSDSDVAVRHVENSIARTAVTVNSVDADANRANFDILVRFKATVGVGSVLRGGVVARASGAAGAETGYTCAINDTELRIGKYSAGTSTTTGTTTGLALSSSATYYWMRFRGQGTVSPVALKAKIWTGLETDEPGTWTLEVSDSTSPITAAGWCGMFSFADGTKHWQDLAVATNGDIATFQAGGGGGSASGDLASVALVPPAASGAGGATAAGSVDSIDLTAPSATASGGSSASATGSLASVALVAPAASSSGGAGAAGAVDSIDLTAPTATASGGNAASATGALASVALLPPGAAGSGGASATGAPDSIDLTAPAAEASGGSTGEGFASGSLPTVVLGAPTADGSGGGAAAGGLAGVDLTPPQGSASTQLPTIARPVADIAQGAWLPSVGSDLYAMLDEADAGGLDYIFATTVGAKCEVELNDTEFPGGASQRFYYEAESATSTSVIVSLKQGTTVIAYWVQALNPSTTVYSRDLSPAEIALIGPGAVSVELEVSA